MPPTGEDAAEDTTPGEESTTGERPAPLPSPPDWSDSLGGFEGDSAMETQPELLRRAIVSDSAPSIDRLPESPTNVPAIPKETMDRTPAPTAVRRPRKISLIGEELETVVWEQKVIQLPDPADDDPDLIAGRYRIEESLGQGGMAKIFQVVHVNLGKPFALKIIHAAMSGDARMRKLFFRESRVLSRLDHPNIVQVTDFGVDPRRGAYIVMEYLKGETLRARLRREGRLPISFALDIGLQCAEALHYMHSQGIIHCDVKSENVFLCKPPAEQRQRSIAKLLDFGLSRGTAHGAKLASSEVAGTPQYMAPEQIRGVAPQPSMDIYALGLLLYEMVVGEVPFRGTVDEVIAAQLYAKPRPPSKLLEHPLDEGLEALIMKALDKDPGARQPSAGQMIFEIRTQMDMLGLRAPRRRTKWVDRPVAPVSGDHRLIVQGCPCPLFRLDTGFRVMTANPALAVFLRVELGELTGNPITDSRLGMIYPDFASDLRAAGADRRHLQRLLRFQKEAGAEVAVMLWIVPAYDASGDVSHYSGIIHPYST